jgi:hypothetical protein
MNLRKPYVWAGLMILLIVLVGFWPSYFGLILQGTLNVGPLVHLHNAVFLGWVLLLSLQASLVANGQTKLHKKLGIFGIFLGVMVVVVGVMTTLNKVAGGIADGGVLEAQQFMLIPLTSMLMFAGFFAAAIYYRSKPTTHKRLMILATVSMLDAPISRMAFLGDPPNPALLMLIWFLPILVLMAADWSQKRKISWLYVTGILIMVLSGARFPISQTEAWLAIARVLSGGN